MFALAHLVIGAGRGAGGRGRRRQPAATAAGTCVGGSSGAAPLLFTAGCSLAALAVLVAAGAPRRFGALIGPVRASRCSSAASRCRLLVVRTTVTLDDDVARAVERLRREQGLALSAAVNALVRRGLARGDEEERPFAQRTSSLGEPRVPLDDIGSALELLEGEAHRG